jgi:ribose transport system ATP-binding protein
MTDQTAQPLSATPDRALVSVRGASKRFGATQALCDVDLDVLPGSVLALLGQNGAGKSTLIKVLAGVYSLDSGEVTVAGHPLGSSEATGRISFIHQDLGLVPGLSVAENVALGTGYPRRRGLIGWAEARRRAERALEIVGSGLDPRAGRGPVTYRPVTGRHRTGPGRRRSGPGPGRADREPARR